MSQNPADPREISTRSQLDSNAEADFSGLEDTARVPHAISRYVIRGELGVGGFGRVYKAFDPLIKREVAIKVPRHGLGWSPEAEDAFLDEARKAAQLRHRHVVAVYDAGRCPVYGVYIVMEFIDGETLTHHLHRQPIPAATAVQIVSQVASAIYHAHQLGLVHRDLKPSNILLDKHGNAHVADFGLALPEERQATERGIISGTLPYMSPEQVRGESHLLDGRSDIWSLGVILYQCLAGKRPFSGDTSETLREEICHREPRPIRQINERVSKHLDEICLKCLSKKISGRYATGKDLEDDLLVWVSQPESGREQASENSGSAISSEEIVASLRRESHRWGIAAAMATMTGVLLAGFVWTFLSSAGSVTDSVDAGAPGVTSAGGVDGRESSAGGAAIAAAAMKEVLVITRPSNARIIVYPVCDPYGFPDGTSRVEAEQRTPARLKLVPGVYLVIAILDDGRFHEVYRHVPLRPHSLAPSPSAHIFWSNRIDGSIEWPTIEIPGAQVTNGMGNFDGSQSFRMGDHASTMTPEHHRYVSPFYLDAHEVDWRTYLANSNNQKPPSLHNVTADMSQSDLPVTGIWYHDAVSYAERIGKRLPTEAEYEFAATRGGTQRFPWGDDPAVITEWPPGAVGTPEFDRVDAGIPVFGLYSNAAEWTSSWASAYPPLLDYEPGLLPRIDGNWIVRGAPFSVMKGQPEAKDFAQGPRQRVAIHEKALHPGIGFRCARSARPRIDAAGLERFLAE